MHIHFNQPEITARKMLKGARATAILGAFFGVVFSLMSFTLEPNSSQAAYAPSSSDSIMSDKESFRSVLSEHEALSTGKSDIRPNPNVAAFVEDYRQREQGSFERMKAWGRKYFDIYDRVLSAYGVPKEMKYLSVIESDLRPRLSSFVGAVGPWQLMDDEAKRFGLHTGRNDDRCDYYKSTEVAAQLMKELYNRFGDWLLVVAAYNAGAGRVHKAITQAGSSNFWDLQYYLPEETRNHVKKFIGANYIFEGSGSVATMTADEAKYYFANFPVYNAMNLAPADTLNTVTTELSGRFTAATIASALQIDAGQFNRWNPAFDQTMLKGMSYTLRLPADKAAVFSQRKDEILMQSVRSILGA